LLQHVRAEGTAVDRGRQYGRRAQPLIKRSIEVYREFFKHFAGWDWDAVRAEASRFRPSIADFDQRYLDEIVGIAEGAEVDEADVLAINVRTEVLSAARARAAMAAVNAGHECSAFGVLPSRTSNGHTLMAQNWDFFTQAADSTIVLEVHQDEGPHFVTVVEAGLLAKVGMNSSGVAVLTNALVTEADRGEIGVPYHILLRGILDSETVSDALRVVLSRKRASSANFILGHADGSIINFESAPGDYTRVFALYPQDGLVLHTNHFASPRFDGRDVSLWSLPHSPFRLERLREVLSEQTSISVDVARGALSDHVNYPMGICCHPDVRVADIEKGGTLASIIMDLTDRRMWVADGNPCQSEYVEFDYGDFLARESPLRAQLGSARPTS
jgi:isopenicillin-N N-acyltransferase-like protein